MVEIPAFPLVEVRGAPFERGVMYGRAASEKINASLSLYSRRLIEKGMTWATIRDLTTSFIDQIEAFSADYLEEIRGIATGANIDIEGILLINCRTEVLQLADRDTRSSIDPDGCTGLVILPPRSETQTLIHAQNWDWRVECAQSSIVLRVLRDDGPNVLTFTEAGALARSGLNSIGTAITANYLECDRDYCQMGVPLPLIRRKALECDTFAGSLGIVATTPKSASNNMMLSNAEGGGFAIDMECAPDETFTILPDDGLLVHANHWKSAVALIKLKEMGLTSVPDSLYRDARVRSVLDSHGRALTVEHAIDALMDRFGWPESVCRPPGEYEGTISCTVAMIVMEPAKGRMRVCPLPTQQTTFSEYSILS
ncbi:isopenicillin-N N-acyltransferase-like protein [Rhizobium sp. PP-CC-2G-626]|nr:isopenicillin-N N-acyltransferase-like protein [Rhizobium sp. PP-CC-2G-626]